jgi:dihydroneopterin aldolase
VSSTPRSADSIHIEELELSVRIGVPDEERVEPQRLTVSMTLWPERDFRGLEDQIGRTVDYAAVCAGVKELASSRTDRLIETLAEAIAQHLLASFPLGRVELELRKFILPEVRFVAVRIDRTAPR